MSKAGLPSSSSSSSSSSSKETAPAARARIAPPPDQAFFTIEILVPVALDAVNDTSPSDEVPASLLEEHLGGKPMRDLIDGAIESIKLYGAPLVQNFKFAYSEDIPASMANAKLVDPGDGEKDYDNMIIGYIHGVHKFFGHRDRFRTFGDRLLEKLREDYYIAEIPSGENDDEYDDADEWEFIVSTVPDRLRVQVTPSHATTPYLEEYYIPIGVVGVRDETAKLDLAQAYHQYVSKDREDAILDDILARFKYFDYIKKEKFEAELKQGQLPTKELQDAVDETLQSKRNTLIVGYIRAFRTMPYLADARRELDASKMKLVEVLRSSTSTFNEKAGDWTFFFRPLSERVVARVGARISAANTSTGREKAPKPSYADTPYSRGRTNGADDENEDENPQAPLPMTPEEMTQAIVELQSQMRYLKMATYSKDETRAL